MAAATPPGTLTVSVINCSDLKSMDWGKNDPYVQLTVGPDGAPVQPRVRNTKIMNNAGKNPHFMEDLSFSIVPMDGLTLDVAVWESDGEENYLMDRLNGKVLIALDTVFRRPAGEYSVKNYEILKVGTKKRVVRGVVRLGLAWQPGADSTDRPPVASAPPQDQLDVAPPMPAMHPGSSRDLTASLPEAEPPKPKLPSGWKEMRMSDGDVYYMNKLTGEQSWKVPGTEDVPAPAPAVTRLLEPEPQPNPQSPPVQPQPQPAGWFYKDPQGLSQGPYSQTDMKAWIDGGFFPESMMVKAPGAPSWLPLHAIRGMVGGATAPPPAPAPAPAARTPAPPTPQILAVTCPQGVIQGHKILVTSPTGQQLQVTVPNGIEPGMVFHIQV